MGLLRPGLLRPGMLRGAGLTWRMGKRVAGPGARRLVAILMLGGGAAGSGAGQIAGASGATATGLTGPAASRFFRYEREVSTAAAGQACAVLDAAIYPHAAPFLKDLRLHQAVGAATYEVPYVLMMSEPQQVDTEYARVNGVALHGRQIVFDLAMPQRKYTDVLLDLDAHDFVATAVVSAAGKPLGTFALFDLAARHLSRSTTLHLQETEAPLLHVVLTMKAAAGSAALKLLTGMVRGASVPPSREAQTLYSVSARSAAMVQRGQQTVATFSVPERVPVERVAVVLERGFNGNFSRAVRISARSEAAADRPAGETEVLTGRIGRVHLNEDGVELREQQMGVPAILGANLQHAATVEVDIENGEEAPLPIAAVVLEMRERKLCFDDGSTASMTLLYGDPELRAPAYAYARDFVPAATPVAAELGPERVIGSFRPRPEERSPGERREPQVIWIGVLLAAFSLGLLAFRSAKRAMR